MKKIILFMNILLITIILSSCMDKKIIELNNITWKEEYFNIEVTSTQLQEQFNNEIDKEDYYSTISIFDEEYFCTFYIVNNHFSINLYDKITNTIIYYYGNDEEFIYGSYTLFKAKQENYKYKLTVDLKGGQYYEYCESNDVDFPNTIVLYGYESK